MGVIVVGVTEGAPVKSVPWEGGRRWGWDGVEMAVEVGG